MDKQYVQVSFLGMHPFPSKNNSKKPKDMFQTLHTLNLHVHSQQVKQTKPKPPKHFI